MNQPTDKKIYNGFVDCVAKTIKNDGIMSLWRGFIPMYVVASATVIMAFNTDVIACSHVSCSWARFAPQATLQLLSIEFLYSAFGFKSI